MSESSHELDNYIPHLHRKKLPKEIEHDFFRAGEFTTGHFDVVEAPRKRQGSTKPH